MDKKYLTYEDFGAVGDGMTDESEAIIACHAEAERLGLPVKTKDGAKYYIGGRDISAHIRTDVDFGTSEFIIDDRSVERPWGAFFKIDSDAEWFSPEIKSLKKGQTHIDFPRKDGRYYVLVENENEKIYIRIGLNKNSGISTHECFTVDRDGNIGEPIDWDYTEITKTRAKSVDDTPITVKGGIFTTIANQAPSFYNYYLRGFVITRSNVTVSGMKHYVTGELPSCGAPYHGFIRIDNAYNVTVEDTLLTERLIYQTPSQISGKLVSMGSYDISVNESISVICRNITQTGSITDERYWGIYTSNFCKDLELYDCVLSRVDAHMGVTGITVKRCRFGYQELRLIGHGNAYVEDTEVYSRTFMSLRGDYGSLWDGDITIKNCKLISSPKHGTISVIETVNDGDHDFGYKCMLGHNVDIENFTFNDLARADTDTKIYIVCNWSGEQAAPKPFKYDFPKNLRLKNIKTESGRKPVPFKNEWAVEDTVITEE